MKTKMTAEEQNIIKTLLENLKQKSGEDEKRDKDIDKQINESVNHTPGSAYYMAQTIIAQQEIIRKLHEHIEQAEDESFKLTFNKPDEEDSGSGFLKNAAKTALTIAGGMGFADVLSTVSEDLGYHENRGDDGSEVDDDFDPGIDDDILDMPIPEDFDAGGYDDGGLDY